MNDAAIAENLDVALDAAHEAGAIALEYFRRPMDIANKDGELGFDPVTEADRRVEAHIRDRLTQRFPDHEIVGEEHGRHGRADTRWVIDPIDGTRAFMSGMPTWGTLIGLVHREQAVAGLVHQPFTRETWLADPLRGARFLHGDADTKLATRRDAVLEDATLYSTHPSMLEAAGLMSRYERLAERCRLQRWGGDCYAFALLAHGAIDLVVDAELQAYDIVALVPIIEQAGGIVTDLHGKSPIEGGTVVAAANEHLHQQALASLTEPKI